MRAWLGVAFALLAPVAPLDEAPAELAPGVPVERELEDRAHAFRLTLAPGQYVRLVVEQPVADVAVRVSSPGGREIADLDGMIAVTGPEELSFVAEEAGPHVIEVLPTERQKARTGRFVLRVAEVRVPTDADRARIPAERALARANRLRFQETADSQRQALAQYDEALALFTPLSDAAGQADVLNNIGEVLFHLGETERARAAFERALPLWRQAGVRGAEAQTLNNLGVVHRFLGEMEKAIDYYHLALPLRRAEGDRRGEAQTLRNIGVVYAFLDEHQQAIDHFLESLPIRREAGDVRGEAYTLHSIGAFYFSLGEHQKALEYARQALELRRSSGDRWGEAQALHSLGQANEALGDRAQALGLLENALAIRRAIGDSAGEGVTLHGIAEVHAASGEHDRALELFAGTLPLRRAAKDRSGEADTLQGMGDAHAAKGNLERAAGYYAEALAIRRALGERGSEAETLVGLARVHRGAGRLGQAQSAVEAALAITDALRAKVARQDLRASYQAARQAEYEFYVDLLMQLEGREPGVGHAVAALAASERARARSLRDMLAEARAEIRTGADPELLALSRRLQDEIRAKERVRLGLVEARESQEKIDVVKRDIEARLNEHRDLEARIRLRSPRYAALTLPPSPTAAGIQALLDDDTLLVEYALGRERSWLWAVTRTSVASFELAGREAIEALALRSYELFRSSQQTTARASAVVAGAELSRLVLGPITGRLREKRLVVVADGALRYVPFAALPDPGSPDGLPMLARHEVVHLPSASVLALLRGDGARERPSRTVAVFADPVFGPGDPRLRQAKAPTTAAQPSDLRRALEDTDVARFERLAFTRGEARAIAALAPTEKRLTALDFDASRTRALEAGLGDYRIVHFATHGLLNSRHPELSGVVLSTVDREGRPQDGFLRLQDIYNLSLRADLVVLSACRTALGQEVHGEGLVGLTGGFMYAGAPRVVASLWDVRDEATAELMKRFYARMLRDGLRPAAALRAAQLSLSKQARWSAPFYWAGFTLQGDWR